ncbi:MAG: indole-3-glycerol phosphate synthase TrpC [candidate division Zixibacteria bacterium]|nr:indole-3-glycerol phosphate synthase TrpC [candidate division Zixibacteria bacterium]
MLEQIVSYKRSQLDAIDTTAGIKMMEAMIGNLPPTISFRAKLQAEPDISIIAEIKRHSPSRGTLNTHLGIIELVRSYERAGAAAISVLTEDRFFRGCPDDLVTTRSNTSLPILRKDFIIDEYQVWESRVIGADAILLIVSVLSGAELARLSRLAQALDLDVITEVHDRSELDVALSLCPRIIGINNRNLATFETDLTTFESLASVVPADTLTISESGVFSRDDILFLKERGADAVLVGESIIVSPDPYLKIRELRGTTP